MKRNLFTGIIGLSIAVMCGCGGGSGTDDDARDISGTWSGALTKVSDGCAGSSAPQVLNFTHVVSQNGEAVTLVDSTGARYLGNMVSLDGFSVDFSGTAEVIGSACPSENRIEYADIDDDDDTSGTLEVHILQHCPGQNSCEVHYSGTASRGSQPATAGTPTPTPSPGTSQLSGGCVDMNPNTAAGSFSGDGSCGLSSARFSLSGSTVFLEPFGSNGSTSFTLDPANTSSGTSVRTDLNINGQSGYGCTIVCSPPATFTVTCRKEGGVSCTEKF